MRLCLLVVLGGASSITIHARQPSLPAHSGRIVDGNGVRGGLQAKGLAFAAAPKRPLIRPRECCGTSSCWSHHGLSTQLRVARLCLHASTSGPHEGSSNGKDSGGSEAGGKRKRMPNFATLTDDSLEKVRSSTSIVEVVSKYVKLQPAGRGMSGCCPFHDDKSPSFSVDDNRGFYHCFGCGAGGDVFKFVMEMEGLSFIEAVKELAQAQGVTLEYKGGPPKAVSSKKQEELEKLSLVLQMAAQFYSRCLVEMPSAGVARRHLVERGVNPRTVMDFQLGYSPPELKSPLMEYLTREGFSPETLVHAGLAVQANQSKSFKGSQQYSTRYFDRFRGRLVVPIRDHRGQVKAFGARDLGQLQPQGGDGTGAGTSVIRKYENGIEPAGPNGSGGKGGSTSKPAKNFKAAKYLNSPETALFSKGNTLFGLDLAKAAIKEENSCVIVEGYFDVIMLHEAGIRHAVGCLGTAITAKQLSLAARHSDRKRIILNLDADTAGVQAVERLCKPGAALSLSKLTEQGLEILVATIPTESGCKDPADAVTLLGAEEYSAQVLSAAQPWIEWYGDRLLARHAFSSSSTEFHTCVESITSFLADLPSPSDRTYHAYRFAEMLGQGNAAKTVQLELDLVNMTGTKEKSKHALRRRLESMGEADEADAIMATLASGEPTQRSVELEEQLPKSSKEDEPKRPVAPPDYQAGSYTSSPSGQQPGQSSVQRRQRQRKKPENVVKGRGGYEIMQVTNKLQAKQSQERRSGGGKWSNKKAQAWTPSLLMQSKSAPQQRVLLSAENFLMALMLHDGAVRPSTLQAVAEHEIEFSTAGLRAMLGYLQRLPEDMRCASAQELFTNLHETLAKEESQPQQPPEVTDALNELVNSREAAALFCDEQAERVASTRTQLAVQEVIPVVLGCKAREEAEQVVGELRAVTQALAEARSNDADAATMEPLQAKQMELSAKLETSSGRVDELETLRALTAQRIGAILAREEAQAHRSNMANEGRYHSEAESSLTDLADDSDMNFAAEGFTDDDFRVEQAKVLEEQAKSSQASSARYDLMDDDEDYYDDDDYEEEDEQVRIAQEAGRADFLAKEHLKQDIAKYVKRIPMGQGSSFQVDPVERDGTLDPDPRDDVKAVLAKLSSGDGSGEGFMDDDDDEGSQRSTPGLGHAWEMRVEPTEREAAAPPPAELDFWEQSMLEDGLWECPEKD